MTPGDDDEPMREVRLPTMPRAGNNKKTARPRAIPPSLAAIHPSFLYDSTNHLKALCLKHPKVVLSCGIVQFGSPGASQSRNSVPPQRSPSSVTNSRNPSSAFNYFRSISMPGRTSEDNSPRTRSAAAPEMRLKPQYKLKSLCADYCTLSCLRPSCPSSLQTNSGYLTTPETPILSSLKENEGHVAAISRSYDPSPISEDVPVLVRKPSNSYSR